MHCFTCKMLCQCGAFNVLLGGKKEIKRVTSFSISCSFSKQVFKRALKKKHQLNTIMGLLSLCIETHNLCYNIKTGMKGEWHTLKTGNASFAPAKLAIIIIKYCLSYGDYIHV